MNSTRFRSPFALCVILLGIVCGRLAAEDDERRYLHFYQARDYQAAVAIAALRVKQTPHDGQWWAYLGGAASELNDHGVAVDAFARCAMYEAGDHLDKYLSLARIRSLAAVKAYASAQLAHVEFVRRFPNSRGAEREGVVARTIARRIESGVTSDNLMWYVDRILTTSAAHPGLAAAYAQEYLLLAARVSDHPRIEEVAVRTAWAAAAMDIGAFRQVLLALKTVRADELGGRPTMLRAQALHLLGQRAEALAQLAQLQVSGIDAGVATRRDRLTQVWTAVDAQKTGGGQADAP